MANCSIVECERVHVARSYCDKHYREQKRRGTLNTPSAYDPRPAIIEGDIAKIPLGVDAKQGYAIVDADMAWLADKLWCGDGKGYAVARVDGRVQYLHYFIIGRAPDGMEIDHINRNKLDDRRVNLRHVTHRVNMNNIGIPKNNTSGYRGVCWAKDRNKWMARTNRKGHGQFIGYFNTPEEAAKARESALTT